HPLFIGVYQGEMSPFEVSEEVNKCDCFLVAGVILHDLDTGIFTAKLNQEHRIVANHDRLNIGHHHYHNVCFVDYIKGLNTLALPQFASIHSSWHTHLGDLFEATQDTKITTKRLFQCLQNHLTSEHIIVSDVGDCLFASSDLVLTQNSYLACSYFASLGF